jgi:predicted TIM-barrel fold metal-dependent hydrolase
MRIIDFHTHYFPEKVVEKAMSTLTAAAPDVKPHTDGTLNGLKDSMKRAGIELSLNLPLATSAESTRGLNRWAALNNKAPVYSFGSIHPDCPDPDDMLAWVKEMDLKGVKMHPEYQAFNVLEPRLCGIWEACIKHDLFVLIHGGGDVAFDPPYRSCPSDFSELLRRFPGLKLVIAHFGSWEMWDEVERELIGSSAYLDLAFTPGILEDEKLVSMIRTHGAGKVLFGTDSPWRDQAAEIAKVDSLPLSEKEKSLIFYENAAQILALD